MEELELILVLFLTYQDRRISNLGKFALIRVS